MNRNRAIPGAGELHQAGPVSRFGEVLSLGVSNDRCEGCRKRRRAAFSHKLSAAGMW